MVPNTSAPVKRCHYDHAMLLSVSVRKYGFLAGPILGAMSAADGDSSTVRVLDCDGRGDCFVHTGWTFWSQG